MHQQMIVRVATILSLALANQASAEPANQAKNCSCEKLMECMNSAKPPPTEKKPPDKITPDKTPKPPPFVKKPVVIKGMQGIPPKFLPINDKDLPGLDFGSGTEQEGRYVGERREFVGPIPAERSKIRDTLRMGRVAAAHGDIPKENLNKLISNLRSQLERVNEREREMHQKELGDQLDEVRKDLDRVDKLNEENTKRAVEWVEKSLDLDSPLEEQLKTIKEVLTDNLGQSRSQELTGGEGRAAFNRALEVIKAIADRIKKDCGGKKTRIQDILAWERTSQLMAVVGENEESLSSKCQKRAVIAKLDTGDILYVAKGCYTPHPVSNSEDRASFNPDWKIEVSGFFTGGGTATIPDGNSGTWESSGQFGGLCSWGQSGPAEIISGAGKCALKLTSATGTAQCPGAGASVPGVSGELPIQILNESCP